MEFECDPAKSAANLANYGLDFVQAEILWQDPARVEVRARTVDEPRWLVVGKINGRHWSAIMIYREQRIRITSVRRSRPEEVAIYEG